MTELDVAPEYATVTLRVPYLPTTGEQHPRSWNWTELCGTVEPVAVVTQDATPTRITGSGKTARWQVSYTVKGGEPDTSKVILEEGYTTLADVPRILAVARGVDAVDVELYALVRLPD